MKEKVYKVISNIFQIPVEEITEDLSPDDTEQWTSLSHMNLLLALEQELNIQFKDEQIVEMLNVALILEAVKENL